MPNLVLVKNELGVPRASIQCKLCGERWVESVHEGRQGSQHSCPEFERKMNALWNRAAIENDEQAKYVLQIVKSKVFEYVPIVWKETGDPTQCTPACKGATGSKCDCVCGGKNHGIHAERHALKA